MFSPEVVRGAREADDPCDDLRERESLTRSSCVYVCTHGCPCLYPSSTQISVASSSGLPTLGSAKAPPGLKGGIVLVARRLFDLRVAVIGQATNLWA